MWVWGGLCGGRGDISPVLPARMSLRRNTGHDDGTKEYSNVEFVDGNTLETLIRVEYLVYEYHNLHNICPTRSRLGPAHSGFIDLRLGIHG